MSSSRKTFVIKELTLIILVLLNKQFFVHLCVCLRGSQSYPVVLEVERLVQICEFKAKGIKFALEVVHMDK